ncbi:hypothetical protein, partial [Mesorhizobium sp. Root552]|uniref:hypothetical protein n=1 Tax=Mesorhizobium sp. Root552 TaxID=1736555 RepID=UPI000B0D0B59
QSSPAPLPAMLPDYEREKLNAEILLNKAAYGACLQIDRLLKETGIENFSKHWREHKADLEKIENF